jgi:hypothetical protein
VVDFSGSTGGYPNPYAYYYSLDGADYTIANSVTSPITIKGLTVVKPYTVTLIAQNAGGFTLPSNMDIGIPSALVEFTNNTYVPPRTGTAESGGTVSQDRKKFVNFTSNVTSPDATLEEQQLQLLILTINRFISLHNLLILKVLPIPELPVTNRQESVVNLVLGVKIQFLIKSINFKKLNLFL